MRKYLSVFLCFVVFFFGCLQFALAQQNEISKSFSEEDRRELKSFHLNDEVLAKYLKTTKELQQHDRMHPDANLAHLKSTFANLSFHDLGNALSKNAEIAAILKKNEMEPQQFVDASAVITIGYMMISMQTAFQGAVTEAVPETKDKMPANMVSEILSDENAAYIQKNLVKIGAAMKSLQQDAESEDESKDQNQHDQPKAVQENIGIKAIPQDTSEPAVEDAKIGNISLPARLPDPCEWYVKEVSTYCKRASAEDCAKQLRVVLIAIDAHLKDTNVMFDSCKKGQDALPSR